MLWPLSVVLVANTNGRLAIPALAGLLVCSRTDIGDGDADRREISHVGPRLKVTPLLDVYLRYGTKYRHTPCPHKKVPLIFYNNVYKYARIFMIFGTQLCN